MEWFRIKTTSLLVRVAVDEIVYIKADGNYSDLVLIDGKSRKITAQLQLIEKEIKTLENSKRLLEDRAIGEYYDESVG